MASNSGTIKVNIIKNERDPSLFMPIFFTKIFSDQQDLYSKQEKCKLILVKAKNYTYVACENDLHCPNLQGFVHYTT
jgi:hypothetical protein